MPGSVLSPSNMKAITDRQFALLWIMHKNKHFQLSSSPTKLKDAWKSIKKSYHTPKLRHLQSTYSGVGEGQKPIKLLSDLFSSITFQMGTCPKNNRI